MLTKYSKTWLFVGYSFIFLMLSNAAWNKAQAQLVVDVGTGTLQNTPISYPAPYGNWYWGAKHQMMVRATELNALGIAGGTMNSLAFFVVI
ncbi:MAG: hypothetical protein FJ343_01280, partial [Sphingomonadales bacterium]|nr:hypothetical protein [Sphingomonadales bacterium]